MRPPGDEVKIGEGQDCLNPSAAAMVHPERAAQLRARPRCLSGFASGMGVDWRCFQIRHERSARLRRRQALGFDHYGFRAFDMPTLFGD